MISIVVWVLYEGRGRGKEVVVLMVVADIKQEYVTSNKVAATCKSVQTPLKVEYVTKHYTNKSQNICCSQLSSTSPPIISSTSNPNHLPHPSTAINTVSMLFHQHQAMRHVATKLPHHELFRTLTTVDVY